MKTNGIFCELDLEMKVRNCFIIVYIRSDYNVFFPHRTVSSARIRNSGLTIDSDKDIEKEGTNTYSLLIGPFLI